MTDSDKANMIFKRYYPNEIKMDKKNSPGGIPQESEIMLARASALQEVLHKYSFSDIEKTEIRWAINYYNNEARNTKNRE
ncbi:MAG: hypothetical protein MR424_07315 [Treponema sp.]|nr:hypothetical protein [Treponema sp.]